MRGVGGECELESVKLEEDKREASYSQVQLRREEDCFRELSLQRIQTYKIMFAPSLFPNIISFSA